MGLAFCVPSELDRAEPLEFPMLSGFPAQAELAQNLKATLSMANGLNAYIYNEGF